MAFTVSVIVPAHNEGENLVDTVDSVLSNACGIDCEVIVADDGGTDGSARRAHRKHGVKVVRGEGLGVGGARNLGAAHASGEVVVFLDGHCYTPAGWLAALIEPLCDPQVGMTGPAIASLAEPDYPRGCGATWTDASLTMEWLTRKQDGPYVVPLLPGGCLALRRADFERVGGFDPGMTRWGSEDFELSLRMWLLGYEVMVQPESVIYHLFRTKQNYSVDSNGVIYNRLRMALLHFNSERCARVFDDLRGVPGSSTTIMWLLESDTMACRQRLLEMRHHDDDWFCQRFNLNI